MAVVEHRMVVVARHKAVVEEHRKVVVVYHMVAEEEVGCIHLVDMENVMEEDILHRISVAGLYVLVGISTYVLVEEHRMVSVMGVRHMAAEDEYRMVVVVGEHRKQVVVEEAGCNRPEEDNLAD